MFQQLTLYWSLFARSFRDKGASGTFRKAFSALLEIAYDLSHEITHRTGTSGSVPLSSVQVYGDNREHGSTYSPSGYRIAGKALAALPAGTRAQVFVDFGCGKGRVLLLAAQHGFTRVIGVEFSSELCAEAREVIKKSGVGAEVIHADAAEYRIPADAGVFYFFNPFDGTIMERVIRNIVASWSAHPRDIFVIYVNAVHERLFEANRFRVAEKLEIGGFTSFVYRLGAPT